MQICRIISSTDKKIVAKADSAGIENSQSKKLFGLRNVRFEKC